jgi:hypothetical protein
MEERTKYAYAKNINNTGDGGIINLFDKTILCWCSKDKADIIINGIESIEALRKVVDCTDKNEFAEAVIIAQRVIDKTISDEN